jgi:hypothetical protein
MISRLKEIDCARWAIKAAGCDEILVAGNISGRGR